MARGKRQELVETALELFHRGGFHATGIDRIRATAGVAKMTLYQHFRSKDELILAALRLHDERFRNEFMRSIERKSDDPEQRMLAIFDVLAELFGSGESGGRTFINACAEYADPDSAIHRAAAGTSAWFSTMCANSPCWPVPETQFASHATCASCWTA